MELLSHGNGIIVYLIVVGILCVGLLVAFILALLLKWDSLTTGVMSFTWTGYAFINSLFLVYLQGQYTPVSQTQARC